MDGYSLFGGSVFGGFGDKDDGSGAPKPAQPAADAPLKSGRAWSPAAGAASAPAGASAKATGRPSSPVFSSEATDSAATDESAAPAPTQAAAPTAAPSAELTADEVQRLQQQVAQLQAEKAQLAALAAQNNRPAGLVDPVKPDAVVDGAAPPDAWQRRQQAAGVASASSMSAQAGGAAQPGSPPPQSSSSAAVVAATGPATEPAAAGGTGAPDKRTGPPTRWPANETGDDDAPPQLRSGPDDTFRLDRPRGARMTEKWQKRWSSNGWAGRPYMIGAKPGGQYKSGGEFAQVVLGVFCQVDRSQLRQVFNNMFIGCAAVLTNEQVRLVQAHPDVDYVRQASRDFM